MSIRATDACPSQLIKRTSDEEIAPLHIKIWDHKVIAQNVAMSLEDDGIYVGMDEEFMLELMPLFNRYLLGRISYRYGDCTFSIDYSFILQDRLEESHNQLDAVLIIL